jgi:H/ACA ribonucleoprotein complex subunit 4
MKEKPKEQKTRKEDKKDDHKETQKEIGLPFERIKRDVLIRKEFPTSQKFGCIPLERPIEQYLDFGVVNLDKPKGPTSHQVSAYAQDALDVKKGGHSGTLDPKVTGVLPIAIGKATRIVQALLVAGKEYVCIMHLHKEIPEDQIRKTMAGFVGKIKQLPPMKSAVKREWRYRKIYYIEILDIKGQDVLFKVGCQAGTYIRKLCHDIGQQIGCGAHMGELRRTKAGPFDETTLVTLQDLMDATWYHKNEKNEKYLRHLVQPIENAVAHLPKVWVFDTSIDSLCHGAELAVPGVSKVHTDIQVGEMVAVMSLKDELVCIGEAIMISKEMQKKNKGIAVKTSKVFMDPGTYPKISKTKTQTEERKEQK